MPTLKIIEEHNNTYLDQNIIFLLILYFPLFIKAKFQKHIKTRRSLAGMHT